VWASGSAQLLRSKNPDDKGRTTDKPSHIRMEFRLEWGMESGMEWGIEWDTALGISWDSVWDNQWACL